MARLLRTAGSSVIEDTPILKGTTPMDITVACNPETGNWPVPTVCLYRGEYLMRDQWDKVTATDTDIIVFCELPMGGGGGGSNVLATIGMIIVMVVAAVVTWGVSLYFTPLIGAGWAAAAGGLAGALVMVAGQALIGSLTAPPKVPSAQMPSLTAEAASPTYSVGGAGSTARLWQPVPELFGKMKVVCDVVTDRWSQYASNEFYIYQVFGLGRGECDVHSLIFGDVTFWENGSFVGPYAADDAIDIQIVPPGGTVTLFPDNVETVPEIGNQELKGPNNNGMPIGPYPCNSPGTTTEEILVDIVFPRGLGRFNDRGDLETLGCHIVGYIQQIDNNGRPVGGSTKVLDVPYANATQTPQRYTETIKVAAARWQITLERPNDQDNTTKALEECRVEAVRAMLPGSLQYEQSVVAVKMRATNTLSSGAASSFSAILTRKLPGWDRNSKTWSSPRATRSFADAVAHVCKASWGGNLKDSQIDLVRLYAIDEEVRRLGWTFDYWIDGPVLVWELLNEICSSFKVVPRMAGEGVSFVMEAPDRPVKAEFNPYNIARGTFCPSWTTWVEETTDDVVVSYLDQNIAYTQKDVRARLEGSVSAKPYRATPLGIVNRDHAYQIADFMAKVNRWRRVSCTFDTEGLGRAITVGDVIRIVHPRCNNVKFTSLDWWDPSDLRLHSPNDIELPEGIPYLTISRPNGTVWGPVLVSRVQENTIYMDPVDYAALLRSGTEAPFPWLSTGVSSNPSVVTLQSGKMMEGRYLVQKVDATSMYRFKITAVIDHPNVYVPAGPTPPVDDRGNLPVEDVLMPPSALQVYIYWEGAAPFANVSWLPARGATAYRAMSSTNNSTWFDHGQFLQTTISFPVQEGNVYIRVQSIKDSTSSAYTTWQGKTTAELPAQPSISVESYTAAVLKLKWAAVIGNPMYKLKVYSGVAGVGGTLLGLFTTSDLGMTFTKDQLTDYGGPWRIMSAELASSNFAGDSNYAYTTITDVAPAALANVVVNATASSISVSASPAVDTDVTGYIAVVLKSATITSEADVLAQKTTILPNATMEGPFSGTVYVAIAAKDRYYDATQVWQDLYFGNPKAVTL